MRYSSTQKLLMSSVPTSIATRIPTGSWSTSTVRDLSMRARIFSATPMPSAAGKSCACRGALPTKFSTARPDLCCALSTIAAFMSLPTALKRWQKNCPGLDWENVVKTANEFNDAVNEAPFDPSKHDGKSTHGISPAKSNWAQRLDTPPYYAFPVTCGITFTFGGIGITEKCEVKDSSENVISGLFAAGEITGGSFFNNYPGGSGLMKGAVFGRLAGTSAATFAKAKHA